MQSLGYHVRIRLRDSRLIASSARERRIVAQVVLSVGRHLGLLVFCLPDDHLHAALGCTRPLAGQFARRVGSGLKQRLGLPVGFAQYDPKPIEDGHHLRNLVRYILRQPEHHGVDADPFREASNLPDLLGLRTLGAYTIGALRTGLPRLARPDLLGYLGVPDLGPADGPPDRVPEAALRASGCASILGRATDAIRVRRAALEVLGGGMSAAGRARLLGTTVRSLQRLRVLPADPGLVSAIRLQLGLEARLGPPRRAAQPF